MQVGIVGPKSSGKTTVFSALTGITADMTQQQAGKPNLGVIKVPDERIEKLSAIFKPPSTVFADIRFVDIQEKAESEKAGKGIDSQTVLQIRNVDALVLVVRAFEDPSVPLPEGGIDPLRDFKAYEDELCITDFLQVETRLERIKKENKTGPERDALEKCMAQLENNMPLRLLTFTPLEMKQITGFQLLTIKPVLVLINVSEDDKKTYTDISSEAAKRGGVTMTLSAKLELEIAQLPPEEQANFCKEMGIEQPARIRFVREVYAMMSLISFFTVGEDEVRAWTIQKGTMAQQAAGKIHSDIEKGFIRATTVHYNDFIKVGSMASARESALLRQEGKTYVVADGDIIEFKFTV